METGTGVQHPVSLPNLNALTVNHNVDQMLTPELLILAGYRYHGL